MCNKVDLLVLDIYRTIFESELGDVTTLVKFNKLLDNIARCLVKYSDLSVINCYDVVSLNKG